MKTFLKKFLILIAIVFSATVVTNLSTPKSAYAEKETARCNINFLGLYTWDCGIENDWKGEEVLTNNIWIIVGNISNDITIIAAYLVLGYAIYGGYLYMLANGDTGKTANGKKTLIHAFTGLATVLFAKIIVSSIHLALLNKGGAFNENCLDATGCTTANELVTHSIQWIIGIAGIVAVTFVIIGAIGYITSSGDSNKLQKAKNTILYALIGLAIVGFAEVITAFVSKTINDAAEKADGNSATSTIIKELSYEN